MIQHEPIVPCDCGALPQLGHCPDCHTDYRWQSDVDVATWREWHDRAHLTALSLALARRYRFWKPVGA